MKVEKRTFIDEHLREQLTDLLMRVPLDAAADDDAGAPSKAYIYVLMEHQSKPQVLMPVRILRYLSAIWDEHRSEHPDAIRVPVILPIVMYHGIPWRASITMDEVYDCPHRTLDAIGEHLPRYAFVLEELLPDDDEALWQRVSGAIPQVILWALTYARREPDLLAAMGRDIATLLADLAEAPSGVAALGMLFTYTMSVARIEREHMARFLKTEVSPMAHQVFTNTYDEIVYKSREQGLEQGLEKGRKEGQQQGRREAEQERLIRLLRARFGRVSRAAQARIKAADQAELDTWYERLFAAGSVAEVMSSDT